METAADSFLSHQSCVHISHAAQQSVPGRCSEYVIDQFEILNIGAYDIVLLVRGLFQGFSDPLIEEFFAV